VNIVRRLRVRRRYRHNRERRRKLHAENPHCYWCGRLTREGLTPPLPDDAATLDHFRSLCDLSPRKANEPQWVLACHACNLRRGIEDQLRFTAAMTKRVQRTKRHLESRIARQIARTARIRWPELEESRAEQS